jgi:hypothetical protein
MRRKGYSPPLVHEYFDGPSLHEQLARLTSIGKQYLSPDKLPVSKASIAERMSWASCRKTERAEDEAYCLLGLFGINMPLLYGEGKNAFLRLQQEILRTSDDASIFIFVRSVVTGSLGSSQALLARSPKAFERSQHVSVGIWPHQEPYVLSNKSLRVFAPLRILSHRLTAYETWSPTHYYTRHASFLLTRTGFGIVGLPPYLHSTAATFVRNCRD